jgi:hypothetical protein
MSLLPCILFFAFIAPAVWGYQSVMAELGQQHVQPADAISRKFQVDEFIWSSRAPLALRRRYIATQACVIPAFLCLAALVWLNEPRPDLRILGAVAFSLMSSLVACTLAWKVARRRNL